MENISYEEFKKLDLRIGEIKAAEDIEGADRIFKLKVDLGGEEIDLIAGIKEHYRKESLIGKKIVVLANLEPRTIRGIISHGMLLAASTADKASVVILTLDKDLPVGSRVS